MSSFGTRIAQGNKGCNEVKADLQLALAGLSTLLEDIKDEGSAVTQSGGTVGQGFSEVFELPGGELPIEHNSACTHPSHFHNRDSCGM